MNAPATKPWVASYAEGVVSEIPTVTESLPQLIERSVARFPQKVALDFFGAETSYGRLGERISRAAEGLRALGVGAGDRVAIVLPNCPEHIVAFYAVLRLGAIVVEHNPLYTPRELRHQFEDHGARVAIVWDKIAPQVQQLPADLEVSTVISVDITRGMPLGKRIALRLPVPAARAARERLHGAAKGTIPWESLLRSPRISETIPRPDGSDIAVIQYTSGTTGTPKGAMLSHTNLISNVEQCQAWIPDIEPGTSVVYAMLPVFHAYGLTLGLTFAMSQGARLVLFPAFDPDLVLAAHKRHPATFLPAVPPIYGRLLARAAEKKVSLRGIRISVSGGMSLDPAMVGLWEAQTGGMLIEGYGLSETSPILMINPLTDARRAGSIGLPVSSTLARIVAPDGADGSELPYGTAGELVVNGPQVFQGYWKRPEETAAVLREGWFRTGDVAVMDERGFITIVDRIKELIITGGFNVSPSEVEEAVIALDGVVDAAVVGLPNAHAGEDVVAAVVMAPGAAFDAEAIRAALRSTLTPYKVPRRVYRLEELPRSMIGKVLRKKVKEQLLGEDA